MSAPRLRFAPSPSGYLHIGGARTALFNWLWARSQGGSFILRIEDTDQERSSLDSVRAILDSMKWLGLDWDEGPEVGGPHGPYFQSERKALYREATETLISRGLAYRCYCTKEALDAQRAALKERDPKAQFVYPGTCRDRTDTPDQPFVVRFKSPESGSTDFVDKVFGAISTPNASQQDFVLVRTDGYPLYNLAAVVDDHAMGITLVARGRDHIGNTPQQVLLYRAFGWEPPEFAHLPMMLSPKGDKLSKRNADVGVQDYRDRGYPAMGVLNYLVRFGWSLGDREIFSRSELIRAFGWDRVGKADGKFDDKKFADVAFEHLKQPELTGLDDYAAWAAPFLERRGLASPEPARLRAAIPLVRERARTLAEAAEMLDYFFRPEPELDPKAAAKALGPGAAEVLGELAEALRGVEPWEGSALEEATRRHVEARGLALKDVAQPARVAVTGRAASPPLFDVMSVLGREQTLHRLARAAGKA
ncbi:MAG: glutamate--tRNA ligase [Sorangiineae bacterium]|nr:glutamate--tRNA ligase [Polyangiaceae bacterium]MEB2320928.1 glutamate--tRNA ligase [Sorangiineae bacterium]